MNRRELLHALGEFRERVVSTPGCTDCRILEDSTDSNRFIWSQWWVDQAQAELAIERTGFRALVGAVQLLGEVETMEWLGRRDGPPNESLKTRTGGAE